MPSPERRAAISLEYWWSVAFSGAQAPTYPTAAGSRGTADTARDVRDFAVKFYTPEGNYDLVGNNMPVFFIQDAIKSPDLIHAVKPEPNSEMPQAASAHDTFWDFVTLMPESTHMLMWIMSDRAIPRSLRMMEGIGVRTFRFVNAAGVSHFVKFHRKPKLGLHAPAWDEAQVLACKDPDFHRRDLWEAIDHGDFPRWELGVQVVAEADEHGLDFDLLDATKLIPEERVPLRPIGRMVLNHKPDNFFAETEQVAFHPGHVVPGIDFSNDPLLQGRLSSCIVTQLRCRLPGLALGLVCSADGASLSVEGTLIITPSVMIDALYRPDRGAGELCLTSHGDAVHFVLEGFKHCNTISAFGSGCALLASLRVACPSTPDVSQPMAGLVLSGAGPLPPEFESVFMAQIGQHRHWARQHLGAVPA